MKKILLIAVAIIPGILFAQDHDQNKDVERIIITKKGADNDKLNIVVDGDNITVNGKPVSKDDDADVSVKRIRIKDVDNFSWNPETGFDQPGSNMTRSRVFRSPNKAMLGVTTEKDEDGVRIVSVNNESAAEKAGLKEGDVITSVDNRKISAPDELSQSLKDKKPGDKVTIGYIREGKKNNSVAELTKWTAPQVMTFDSINGNNFNAPDMDNIMKNIPRNWNNEGNNGMQFYNFRRNNGPRLGIQIKEVEKGSGVKVVEVEKESDADRAGIKEGDIIKEVNGNIINNADEIINEIGKNKAGSSVKLKVERNGRMQSIDVEFSKKLKSANL